MSVRNDETMYWIKSLDKCTPVVMPNDLYERIKLDMTNSFERDFNMLIEEFDFYFYLSPRLQG